jgi:hypothetical protein
VAVQRMYIYTTICGRNVHSNYSYLMPYMYWLRPMLIMRECLGGEAISPRVRARRRMTAQLSRDANRSALPSPSGSRRC